MADYRKVAKRYVKAGFSVIPVNSEKNPAMKRWEEFQERVMTEQEIDENFRDVWGIALIMGGHKNLTAIDIDLKNSIVHDFFDRYQRSIPNDIYGKFFIQKTKNNGFHFVFSSDIIEPNQKLASRETTPEERHVIYMDNFADLRTRGKALKLAINHKSKVLVETRGKGGYIVIYPSPGYTSIQGKIGHLDIKEYQHLMTVSRSFNEFEEEYIDFRIAKYKNRDIDPFTEFNERGDSVKILLDNGWNVVAESKRNIRLKRPGDSSPSSGLYDKETRVFRNYSTNADGLDARAYSPSSLYTVLECDNDVSLANKKLINLGYAEKAS